MTETHLLAFHIGPVQDFIATARRTQDWWMGSWLLAHLSKIAIKKAKDEGACLVLPKECFDHLDAVIADTPNHFLARIKDGNAEDIARRVEDNVRKEWKCIHDKVKKEFFAIFGFDGIWKRQVENFLEIYWVVVADDGSPTARSRAHAAIEARKRLRSFGWIEEPDLKCVLCGARQELSGEVGIAKARDRWKDLVAQYLKSRGHLLKLRVRENGNERLCAICAVKRAAVAADAAPNLHKTNGSFPSTSSVASAIFKKRVIELIGNGKSHNELTDHLRRLRDIIKIPENKVEGDCVPKLAQLVDSLPSDKKAICEKLLTFDGDLFYEETFTEKRISDEYPEAESKQAESGAVTLRSLFKAVGEPPSKYFAALMMDGDHMGAFYGSATEEKAGEMSERMSQFARQEARDAINQSFGRLVYAGGDDVLAMLPLETVLECARNLRDKFNDAVKKVLPTDDNLPKGAMRPTPSIGIAVAHHTQPLETTLLAMQQAERNAKNTYGRNALCVHVLKRSGAEMRVGMQWKTEGNNDSVEVVTGLADLLKKKALSMRFPTSFAAEAQFLPPGAIEAELARLGRRQKGEQFERHENEVKNWFERASKLARAIGAGRLAEWTLLGRFIASGGRDD